MGIHTIYRVCIHNIVYYLLQKIVCYHDLFILLSFIQEGDHLKFKNYLDQLIGCLSAPKNKIDPETQLHCDILR